MRAKKPKISIPKKKLIETEKHFSELRHTFSKEEIDKFQKSFHNIINHKNLFTSEIREAEKSLLELEESLQSKKCYDDDDDDDDDDEYRETGNIRRLFEGFKPIKTDNFRW